MALSPPLVPTQDTAPPDQPANGAGGEQGTHEGHADCVPTYESPYGLGMEDDRSNQTAGNAAAKQYATERGQG